MNVNNTPMREWCEKNKVFHIAEWHFFSIFAAKCRD